MHITYVKANIGKCRSCMLTANTGTKVSAYHVIKMLILERSPLHIMDKILKGIIGWRIACSNFRTILVGMSSGSLHKSCQPCPRWSLVS